MSTNIKYAFQKKRDKAKHDLEERKLEIYTFIPRIKDIEEIIRKKGLEIAKAIIKDPINAGISLNNIKNQMNKLRQEKAFLLTEHNIPIDYLEIHFKCKSCNDTGFLKNGSKCHCYVQEKIKLHYKYCNLTDILEKENFNTFDINIFSEEYDESIKSSPKEYMISVLATCESFVYDFKKQDKKNMIFIGSTGLGKTFLCNCIAKALLDKGITVLYQTAFRIIDTISTYRFSSKKTAEMKFNYDLLIECDLLIIDDLGTEMMNSFTNIEFFNIINTRLLENKKTLISTNFSPSQIQENYSDRVSSRIFGYYEFVQFAGKDLRWET